MTNKIPDRPDDVVRHFPDVYVTKYALAQGILHYKNGTSTDHYEWRDGERRVRDGTRAVKVHDAHGCNGEVSFCNPRDWHVTLEGAEERVREMVRAKIRALEKQRVRLEKLVQNGAPVKEMEPAEEIK